MVSPISLPVARLRAAGAKVGAVIGHDPLTTGSHPNGRPNWHYRIDLPEGMKKFDLDEALWKYDHSWSTGLGEAVCYFHQFGGIIVYARQPDDPKVKSPAMLRSVRREVERQVAELLSRIASVLEAKTPAVATTGEDRA